MRTFSTELRVALDAVAGVSSVLVFGSVLTSDTPRDIDLAVVYEEPLVPKTASSVLPVITEAALKTFGLHTHVTLFTPAEASESPLLAQSLIVYQRGI